MSGWNRCKWAFASAILTALVGCGSTPKTPAVIQPPPPANVVQASNTVRIAEPVDDQQGAPSGPLASSSLLVFASTWVEAVKNDPNKPPPERERLLTQARQVYAEVLARDPRNIDAMLGQAQMYQVTGEFEKIAETEKRLRETHPNSPKVWAWIAVRQGQNREWDNAAESYHTATKLDPDNRMYRIHLGFTLARGGRYEEGYAWLSRSMRETEARYNLAMMMVHNGHGDQAKQQLQFALQVDQNFRPATDALAAIANGQQNVAPLPNVDSGIRTVNYEQPTATPRPLTPRPIPVSEMGMPPEPLPVGVSGPTMRQPLPPAYTETTGWDTTLPPRR